MEGVYITWPILLLVAVVLATGVYLLEVLVFSRRRRPADTQVSKPAAPQDQTPVFQEELARLREEVSILRRRLDAMEAQTNRLPAPPPVQDDSPYGQAVRMARQGLAAQELAVRCGISRGEAELIIALNRGDEQGP